MEDATITRTVDTTGLQRPLPLLKVKKALSEIETEQVLKVISSDLELRSDIALLINRLGHELLRETESGGEISFYIKKRV